MKGHDARLVLYHFASCPYCIKVREYLKHRHIVIPMRDILLDPDALDQLISVGGKQQVPCLVVGGKALYESQDIIMWFENQWDHNKR